MSGDGQLWALAVTAPLCAVKVQSLQTWEPGPSPVSSPQPSPSPQRTQTLEKGRGSDRSLLVRVKNGTEEGKSHAIRSVS